MKPRAVRVLNLSNKERVQQFINVTLGFEDDLILISSNHPACTCKVCSHLILRKSIFEKYLSQASTTDAVSICVMSLTFPNQSCPILSCQNIFCNALSCVWGVFFVLSPTPSTISPCVPELCWSNSANCRSSQGNNVFLRNSAQNSKRNSAVGESVNFGMNALGPAEASFGVAGWNISQANMASPSPVIIDEVGSEDFISQHVPHFVKNPTWGITHHQAHPANISHSYWCICQQFIS